MDLLVERTLSDDASTPAHANLTAVNFDNQGTMTTDSDHDQEKGISNLTRRIVMIFGGENDQQDEDDEPGGLRQSITEIYVIRMKVTPDDWTGNLSSGMDVYSVLDPLCGHILDYLAKSDFSSHLINVLANTRVLRPYMYTDIQLIYYMGEDKFEILPKTREIVNDLSSFTNNYSGSVKLVGFQSKNEDDILLPGCATDENKNGGDLNKVDSEDQRTESDDREVDDNQQTTETREHMTTNAIDHTETDANRPEGNRLYARSVCAFWLILMGAEYHSEILDYLDEYDTGSHLIGAIINYIMGGLTLYAEVKLTYYLDVDGFKRLPTAEQMVQQLKSFAKTYKGSASLGGLSFIYSSPTDDRATVFTDCAMNASEAEYDINERGTGDRKADSDGSKDEDTHKTTKSEHDMNSVKDEHIQADLNDNKIGDKPKGEKLRDQMNKNSSLCHVLTNVTMPNSFDDRCL
ncbi:unnamed protein product [Echinostoma caproni]|uniref:HORMA domain-containing protein n=1 Tax=Echinostoma caproni TaxID=27848 RepID=A0A183ARQ0_9TREM|nr:unnamed protein product [Echinostoma caproni]